MNSSFASKGVTAHISLVQTTWIKCNAHKVYYTINYTLINYTLINYTLINYTLINYTLINYTLVLFDDIITMT